ncbi:hypothetical protein T310_9441, partial [Rasamsonia emersonii CBS 393.64]
AFWHNQSALFFLYPNLPAKLPVAMPTRSSLKTNWAYAIRTDENPTEAGPPQERLMKKAYEYSVLCAADVFLAIIIRENGRVYTLCLDQAGILSHIQSQSVSSSSITCCCSRC